MDRLRGGIIDSLLVRLENSQWTDYKLQDQVEALKTAYGIRDDYVLSEEDGSKASGRKKNDAAQVKDSLRPPVPSTFKTIVNDLKDTVKSSYWDKEIGKTVYSPPRLPTGLDPLRTTFGKVTGRDDFGVSDLVNPKKMISDDCDVHELYRKSHNDYYPDEQINRNYLPPFDKISSFGDEKKKADFSGKRVANCLQWVNNNPMTLVSRRLADFLKRTESRLGTIKNRDKFLANLTFAKNANGAEKGVAEVLKETFDSPDEIYCSDYAERISKACGSSRAINNRAAGVPSERTDLPYVVVPEGAARAEKENLGDQTSVMALISPNTFTQLGLSHFEFFQIREYEEMRSIFENIGVEFPDNSFDIIWKEGLKKDCTGGVCVETFRNLLARLARNTYNSHELS